MTMIKWIFLLLLSISLSPLVAYISVESPQATSVGSRFRSLGYNIVSIPGDVSGVLSNPAALTDIEYMQISFGNQSHLGHFEYNLFNIAYPYKSFVFSLSYASNMLNSIPLTTERDNTIYPVSYYNSGWKLFHFGFTDDYYIDFFVDKFSYGVGLKLLQQELVSKRRSGGLDLGLMGSKYIDNFFGLNEIVIELHF